MSAFKDISGHRFGMLVAIRRKKIPGGRTHWVVRCDCGKIKTVQKDYLINKQTKIKSCGCYSLKNPPKRTHGMSGTKEYRTWKKMRQRCGSPTDQRYPYYGGRGIRVCEEWGTFQRFFADMGKAPTKNHSIERLDNNGDYKPGNCVWANASTQNKNRRTNVFLTFNGETMCISDWAKKTGISQSLIRARVKKMRWAVDRALTEKPYLGKNQTNKGGFDA